MHPAPPPVSSVLTPAEIQRYKRHLVLKDVGGPGQQKLKAARVLVIGAGGLGGLALAPRLSTILVRSIPAWATLTTTR